MDKWSGEDSQERSPLCREGPDWREVMIHTNTGGGTLGQKEEEGHRSDLETWVSEGSLQTTEGWGVRVGRSLGSLQTPFHFKRLFFYLLCIFG